MLTDMATHIAQQFFSQISRPSADACWIFTGKKNRGGYGYLKCGKNTLMAHRVSFLIHNGLIPDKLLVRHTCDNPPCVNPRHLLVGTHADNARDKIERGRAVYNPQGIKLNKTSAAKIRLMRREGRSIKELAKIYNVGISAIIDVCKNKRWHNEDETPIAHFRSKSPARKCAVTECKTIVQGRRHCVLHAFRLKRFGDPHYVRPDTPPDPCIKCGEPSRARQLCSKHYQDFLVFEAGKKCTVCGEPAKAKGMCNLHYKRARKSGIAMEAPRQKVGRQPRHVREALPPPSPTCRECDSPVRSGGLCVKHHSRFIRYGDVNTVKKSKVRMLGQCIDSDCDRPAIAKERCTKHYQRWRNSPAT